MTHTLYRFFDQTGTLLYVGRTINPQRRISEHRKDKPWWEQVADIKLTKYESARELEEAETAAIKAEHPLHNKTHNGGQLIGLLDYVRKDVEGFDPLAVGSHVALGLIDSRCPVGRITSRTDSYVSLRLKDWLTGYYCGDHRSYPIDDIRQIVHADDDGQVVWDENLAAFQTRWCQAS